MSNGNTVTVVGNITRDPELRFLPSGQGLTNFGLAVNRRWQNRQTQAWEEATSFFDITCWGTLGENVCESLEKGARVVVTGRLDQRSWQTQEGEKRSKVEIVAEEVGPSLRWATAKVTRNERKSADDNSGPAPEHAAVGARDGGSEPSYSSDEEPF